MTSKAQRVLSVFPLTTTLKIVAATALLSSCYASKQIYYQGNLLATRQSVSYLLWKHDTSPQLKKQLTILLDILDYAESQGLHVGGAYQTYIKSPSSDGVSYLVQAAPPLELHLKKWSFPIVGDVPYLGFFHKEDRDEEAKELKEQGYDVSLGQAEAFSTLGWLDDPVFSTMLERDEASLAHLLFHELTHRTIWISGQADFNENLAEFVGITLTRQYLTQKKLFAEQKEYDEELEDRLLFVGWLEKLKKDLQKVYDGKDSEAQKKLAKQATFDRYLAQDFPAFKAKGYQKIKHKAWNNASVLGASMYLPDLKPFERSFACSHAKKMIDYLERLKDLNKKEGDPLKALAHLCPEGKVPLSQ